MPMQCNSRHDMCSIATLTSHLPASPLHRRTFATWHFRTFALASSHFCSYALEAKVRSLKWPQQNSIQNCEIQIIYPYNRQGPHKLSSTLLCPLDKVRLGLEETLAADHSSHQTRKQFLQHQRYCTILRRRLFQKCHIFKVARQAKALFHRMSNYIF